MTPKGIVLLVYIIYLFLISVVTFFTYKADKKKAKAGKWRIKERTLLLLSFFGGAYGGFIAMQVFRHKTKGEHWYFTVVNLLGIIIHTSILICIAFIFKF